MERHTKIKPSTDYIRARKIMGNHIIGPLELQKVKSVMNLSAHLLEVSKVPKILISEKQLGVLKKNGYLLVLGIPKDNSNKTITINYLRNRFGWDSSKKEPCFYNQDWYVNESFAQTPLQFKWYAIRNTIIPKSRGKSPDELIKTINNVEVFPQAILTAFTFFSYYFITGGTILWHNDFIWCSDKDHSGDRIYTGRYIDPKGTNKKGFNVHRHLTISRIYGTAPEYNI